MRLSFVGLFLIKAIFWLLVCLGVWYLITPYLAMPVAYLANWVVDFLFPVWAEGVERDGNALVLLTRLEMPIAGAIQSGRVAVLTPEVDFRIYGYGLPLLAALLLASRAGRPLPKILLGAVLLLPFQVWGVCFDWLKQIAISSGPQIYWSTQLAGYEKELIAWGYQFGFLVLPTLIPVMAWAYMDSRFLSTFLLEAALDGASESRADGGDAGK